MVRDFVYPVSLKKDRQAGGYLVRFKDLPEAITQGDDLKDALSHAADCLEEAIAGRIRRSDPIPRPSRPTRGQKLIPVPPLMACKGALYLAIEESGITNSELARRIRCDEKEIRRMLDPRHPTKLPRIQQALAALGCLLVLSVQKAA